MSYEPPPAPDQPPYGYVPGGTRPAELMDRFLARLIDFVLLFVVNIIIVSVVIIGAIMGESGGAGFGMGGSFAVGAVTAILTTIIYLGYFSFLESSRGQTLGKMVMKLRVVGPQGGNPTLEQADTTQHLGGLGNPRHRPDPRRTRRWPSWARSSPW